MLSKDPSFSDAQNGRVHKLTVYSLEYHIWAIVSVKFYTFEKGALGVKMLPRVAATESVFDRTESPSARALRAPFGLKARLH